MLQPGAPLLTETLFRPERERISVSLILYILKYKAFLEVNRINKEKVTIHLRRNA